MFKGWRPFEIVWLGLFVGISVVLTVLFKDTLIGFLAFLFGVVCVVLTAKGSIYGYLYGYVNTVLYAYIAYRNGLYGEMGLNLFFFLPTGIVGFILWKRNIRKAGKLIMRKLPLQGVLVVAFICVAGALVMGYGLSMIKTQNTPYIDAATNMLSVVATVLMIWRFREQWLVYIALNVFTIVMWTFRLLNGSPDAVLMLVMWSAYLVNACYGFYNWTKGAKGFEQNENSRTDSREICTIP